MSTPTCRCGQPITDSASICRACGEQLATDLRAVPGLVRDLGISYGRLSRSGGGTNRGSSERPLPFDARAKAAYRTMATDLAGWARIVLEERFTDPVEGPVCQTACLHLTCARIRAQAGPASPSPADVAPWLLGHVQFLRHHPAGDECARDIGRAVVRAREVVDRAPQTWSAGRCDAELPDTDQAEARVCGGELRAELTATFVRCPRCRATYDIASRRKALLEDAEDQLAPVSVIAWALTSLQERVSEERIRTWVKRQRLVRRSWSVDGRPTYRVGDVRALLEEDARARERGEKRGRRPEAMSA